MANTDPRKQIIETMRANLNLISADLTGFLDGQCRDLLEAGIDRTALSYSLMTLALRNNVLVVGVDETIDQLRRVADVLDEKKRAQASGVRH